MVSELPQECRNFPDEIVKWIIVWKDSISLWKFYSFTFCRYWLFPTKYELTLLFCCFMECHVMELFNWFSSSQRTFLQGPEEWVRLVEVHCTFDSASRKIIIWKVGMPKWNYATNEWFFQMGYPYHEAKYHQYFYNRTNLNQKKKLQYFNKNFIRISFDFKISLVIVPKWSTYLKQGVRFFFMMM